MNRREIAVNIPFYPVFFVLNNRHVLKSMNFVEMKKIFYGQYKIHSFCEVSLWSGKNRNVSFFSTICHVYVSVSEIWNDLNVVSIDYF